MNQDHPSTPEIHQPATDLGPVQALEAQVRGWIEGQRSQVERLARHGHAPWDETDSQEFERLALAAFALQFERIAPYRRLCESRRATPETVRRWQDIPAVPVLAFKTLDLHLAPAREVFRSSGTTGSVRSVHHQPFPDLYRRIVDTSFPAFCLAGLGHDKPPMLALVPSRQQAEDSSLGFMIDHVVRRFGGDDSLNALGPNGVDLAQAEAWLARRRDDRRAALVLATSFALVQWIEGRRAGGGEGSGLPEGSVVFDTGGYKGRSRELSREELTGWIADDLGVPATRVVREYGMTELTSQLYTRTLHGDDGEHFVAPPWLRPRVVDPATLDEVPAGTRGVVALFDLGNLGSAVHLVTQDAGRMEPAGLRLEGRATGAELRGCSLTVEELARDA